MNILILQPKFWKLLAQKTPFGQVLQTKPNHSTRYVYTLTKKLTDV